MRGKKAKVHSMPVKPIVLKGRIEKSKISINKFALAAGVSKGTLMNALDKAGYMPSRVPDFKKKVEKACKKYRIETADIWLPKITSSDLSSLPMCPIRLKSLLRMEGIVQDDFAREVKMSRTNLREVLNRAYVPSCDPGYKQRIEAALKRRGISAHGMWEEDMGHAGRHLQRVRKFQKRWGSLSVGARCNVPVQNIDKEEKMNVTKEFLDFEVMNHFGLKDDPFYDIVDFNDIWLSPKMKVMERRVRDVIKRHGIMAVVGEIGAGKTTFLRYVLNKLQAEKEVELIMPDRMERWKMTGDSIARTIIMHLGGGKVPHSVDRQNLLAKRILEDAVKNGVNPVIVIDEAHDLTSAVLISLKRVWDSGLIFKLLAILLVGQGGAGHNGSSGYAHGLSRTLQRDISIREFAERCLLIDLGRLNGNMAEYLGYRFKKAGADFRRIFESKAVAFLTKRAGVPQLANNIAVRAMRIAYEMGSRVVTADHVNDV